MGGKVIKEFETERVVAGVPVLLRELVWNDGGRSWEVLRLDLDEGEDNEITGDGCLDEKPGDELIAALLAPGKVWTCPGCGNQYDPGSDVVDHVNNCEWVDGAGRPRYGKAWL